MAKKTDRFVYNGKNRYEKEAYRNFVESKFRLDKTEDDPPDLNKTDTSSVEQDEILPANITRKSFKLKIGDFVRSNIGTTIVGGLALIVAGAIFKTYVDTEKTLTSHSEKISNIENEFDDIKTSAEKNLESTNGLKNAFEIFKAEVNKDFDYLKRALDL